MAFRETLRSIARTGQQTFCEEYPFLCRIGRFLGLLSYAKGGIVRAPPGGRLARVHNKELLVPKRKVKSVMKALRKSKVARPISALRR
jgi:hypothetical protein